MSEERHSASRTEMASLFPRYSAAVLGFRNYWYPVLLARDLGRKPKAIKLCGEKIVLVRDQGRVYALHDRCPHRGVPLSAGRREFPGMLTCAYHGWTYDLATGRLEVVLTDGPDSPICGKANVRTYPVEERAGLIWVYIGDEPRPPVEQDIPTELLRPNTVLEGVVARRRGNWRFAAEAGIDEGHARYLHRRSLWTVTREMPAWIQIHMAPSADGEWLARIPDRVVWRDTYPRAGEWPPKPYPWQRRARGAVEVGCRLPCWLRVQQRGWTGYEIYVPWDANHYQYLLLAAHWTQGLDAVWFRAKYRAWLRWVYHGEFNSRDLWAVETMEIPPERLYRPDVSIMAWRKLCETEARGAPQGVPQPAPEPQPAGADAR
jgi:phenylpropionate dioxygenase-like ring-hydroxylating dioxygenase large terminal subunit